MQSRFKHAALYSVKLLLSIAVLVYIARGLDLRQLRDHLVSVDPVPFAVALALIFFRLWFNQVLPSSVGGDVERIWLLRQRDEQGGGRAKLRAGQRGLEPPMTRWSLLPIWSSQGGIVSLAHASHSSVAR